MHILNPSCTPFAIQVSNLLFRELSGHKSIDLCKATQLESNLEIQLAWQREAVALLKIIVQ